MLFSEWIRKNEYTQERIAELLQTTQSTVSEGIRFGFSKQLAPKVVLLTGGDVNLSEALFGEEKRAVNNG